MVQAKNTTGFIIASTNPERALHNVTAVGKQIPEYKVGYEEWFNLMPILQDGDKLLKAKTIIAHTILEDLNQQMLIAPWIDKMMQVEAGGLVRVVIGIEEPQMPEYAQVPFESGNELFVAKWGNGMATPVHGHPHGFMADILIRGKLLHTVYRVMDAEKRIAKLIRTEIIDKPGIVVQTHHEAPKDGTHSPFDLIHKFVAVGETVTMHFVQQHPTGGAGSTFTTETFEEHIALDVKDVFMVTINDLLTAQVGQVFLVRSEHLPEFAEHYAVIVGKPKMTEAGLRPQVIRMEAPNTKELLNKYPTRYGVVALQLDRTTTEAFYYFHNIQMNNSNEVVFHS